MVYQECTDILSLETLSHDTLWPRHACFCDVCQLCTGTISRGRVQCAGVLKEGYGKC